jgi:hypothetical protein
MQPETEIIEATELATIEQPTVTAPGLFGTDNPKLVIARAVEVADELARVIRDKKLSIRIRGKEHVLVEGWTLLGTMLGVFPVLEWSRKLDDGWEARVQACSPVIGIVGAAESECLRSETRWANAEDYAIRSMAATRATSKALRQPLGFVMQLAGFEATPAEEIPQEAPSKPSSPVGGAEPSKEQLEEIQTLVRTLKAIDLETDWSERCHEIAGVPARMLTRGGAGYLIDKLRAELARLNEQDGADA